jgi:hypothetical protein
MAAQWSSAGAVCQLVASGFGSGMGASFLGLGVMAVPKHPDFDFSVVRGQQRSG